MVYDAGRLAGWLCGKERATQQVIATMGKTHCKRPIGDLADDGRGSSLTNSNLTNRLLGVKVEFSDNSTHRNNSCNDLSVLVRSLLGMHKERSKAPHILSDSTGFF